MAQLPVCRHNQRSTNLRRFKRKLFHWQTLPESCWPAVYYENHDQPRSIPRFAPSGALRQRSAKSLALSLLFQRGTPFIYQGQELGMTNVPFQEKDYRDIQAVNQIKAARSRLFAKIEMPFLLRYLGRYSRDHARTPMQWDNSANAGFTTGTPWLMVNPNYRQINAAEQGERADSVLNFYRQALRLRNEWIDLIRDGSFVPVDPKNKNVMAYARRQGGRTLLVLCSLSPKESSVCLPAEYLKGNCKLLLGNMEQAPELREKTLLQPCQCALFAIED